MEAASTLNFGSASARGFLQREAFQLKHLENQARHLATAKPGSAGQEGSGQQDEQLMGVARQFESLLIHQMLKAMRRTVQKSDLLNSFSLQQYESMLDEEIAKEMAEHKGLGLADMLYHQLRRINDPADPKSTQMALQPKPQVNYNE